MATGGYFVSPPSRDTSFNYGNTPSASFINSSLNTSKTLGSRSVRGSEIGVSGKRNRRSVLPRGNSSRLSVGGWSSVTHNNAICESSHYSVECYGLSLPAFVVEALTFADSTTAASMSAQLSPSGWAWLVCGIRLLVWPYKQETQVGFPCRELPLPPSDVAHCADLVCVIINGKDKSHVPSCIAASPEGLIRFWPSIAHERVFVEVSAQLQGQECDSLTPVLPLGFILATTTATLLLVRPLLISGRYNLTCQPFRASQGWLGGFSRKLTSVIFGGMSTQSMEAKLVKVVAAPNGQQSDQVVFVLSGHTLQKWHLDTEGQEILVYECNMDRLVREVFCTRLWERNNSTFPAVNSWLIDMQISRGRVIILASAVNRQISTQLYYALASVDISSDECPDHISSFLLLNIPSMYETDGDATNMKSMRFSMVSGRAYLYTKKSLYGCLLDENNPEIDCLPIPSSMEYLLGVGTTGLQFVVFLSENWLASVNPKLPIDATDDETPSFSQEHVSNVLTSSTYIMMSESVMENLDLTLPEDKTELLKNAFLKYCCKDMRGCEQLLEFTFPFSNKKDQLLDSTIITISIGILDEKPKCDPRWTANDGTRGSYNTSILIPNQLKDKQNAHDLFITFIKGTQLFARLSTVFYHNTEVRTNLLLAELSEKAPTALTLHSLHSKHKITIEAAILKVLEMREIEVPEELSNSDVFYAQSSDIEDIIPALVQGLQEQLTTFTTSKETAEAVIAVGSIVFAMINTALEIRHEKWECFSQQQSPVIDLEHEAWNLNCGMGSIRDALKTFHGIIYDDGIKHVDNKNRNRMISLLAGITDLILEGYNSQIKTISKNTERYHIVHNQFERDRAKLIEKLFDLEEHERAAHLAEKYHEFKILIRLCQLTKDKQRLEQYMVQFDEQGFRSFVYNWYLVTACKPGELLTLYQDRDELSHFLKSRDPTLRVVHDLGAKRYSEAAETLRNISSQERESVYKKKCQLSLAKLVVVVSKEADEEKVRQVEEIDRELLLIMYQEHLPPRILRTLELIDEQVHVMTPVEIIQLYISENNEPASAHDFKKALDLLQFIHDEDLLHQTRLMIWCRAVLCDSWSFKNTTDDPLDIISKSLVFRIVKLGHTQGENMRDFLPPLDQLLKCEDLNVLNGKPQFQYLMQAGYEHVLNSMIQ